MLHLSRRLSALQPRQCMLTSRTHAAASRCNSPRSDTKTAAACCAFCAPIEAATATLISSTNGLDFALDWLSWSVRSSSPPAGLQITRRAKTNGCHPRMCMFRARLHARCNRPSTNVLVHMRLRHVAVSTPTRLVMAESVEVWRLQECARRRMSCALAKGQVEAR